MYSEVQCLLPTFSGPTALHGLEDFWIQFEQICVNNEIPKSSWGLLLFSKMEGEPAKIIQWHPEREHGSYDNGMGRVAHVYIKCNTWKMAERDLAKR